MSIISLGFVDTKLTITEDMDDFQPRQSILDIVGEKENSNCNSSDPFFPFATYSPKRKTSSVHFKMQGKSTTQCQSPHFQMLYFV